MKILYLPNCNSQQRQHEKSTLIYPILLAMQAQYYRNKGHDVDWIQQTRNILHYDKVISEPEKIPFLELPHADRVWTHAKDKHYQANGNFKYNPGTYILSASGCWWGKCRFCVETQEVYQKREVADVIEEIKECKRLGFREIFDDSATFPIGRWLDDFALQIKDVGIRFSCNMRLLDLDYCRLRDSGFRMVLFGLESANQETLDRIRKGTRCEDVKYLIKAALSGIEPHITVMFGYPWESDEDALRTLRLTWTLLKKGYAKTAQASFYTPTKATPAGQKNESGKENHRQYVNQIYKVAYSPEFWFNQISSIRNIDDLKYIWKGIKHGLKAINNTAR